MTRLCPKGLRELGLIVVVPISEQLFRVMKIIRAGLAAF